jgi:hypothetical protein
LPPRISKKKPESSHPELSQKSAQIELKNLRIFFEKICRSLGNLPEATAELENENGESGLGAAEHTDRQDIFSQSLPLMMDFD